MQFPDLETLRARGTRKWTQFEDDVLPLWVAESDFPTAEPVKSAIQDAVDREMFGYTPAHHTLGDSLSRFYSEQYGWTPNPEHIFPVADVVRGMLLGIQYFTKPGSPVIVPVPSYPPFLELPETAGREMVEVGAKDGLDLMEIEAAFKNGAGSILLAAPNNPWGYTFDEEELVQITNIADKYGARVLVDEIHAPIVYEGKHHCAAGVSDTAANVCITVTATSKAWNVAGLKCAQMVFSNEKDVDTWKNLTGVAKDGTGTLGIVAAQACYDHGKEALDDQLKTLKANRDYLIENLPEAVPGIQFTKPEATYLMFLDFSGTVIEDEKPATWIRREAKVALNEGVTFGPGGAHHARLNFATSPEILSEALDRISTAIVRGHGLH
ncbi:aminotransferase class I/II-fold pyridoxal phosphate-dependent enzyme [Corynebacterium sp. p3-SID1145]|uniref:MalY/PatB family protein n=1 Tax=unclassified Corynebacterium TaxID=2624378 RepID=UPI0021A9F439|nr:MULTISPECIES: aminotransferase class I/II-fold pyridoxal phosphate-dependent enzyme [unclassified Corynebacterium]MCT1452640.1 aminotransferase class I/II-fold pyridoxal phosphate-dependent enzyme [Corynebacterium sp. p3-SID1145]MCT1461542.1 aminotransferase class I/II-fold pyridoxal phosphate-dependent enzyme [Corynebacterium sp. p3-SID1140]